MTLEHHPSRRWLRPVTVLGLFVVALTAWTFYLTQAELAVFNDPEGNAMQKWTTWLGVPLACVLTIMLAHWSLSASAAAPAQTREVWHFGRDEAAANPEWKLEGIQQLDM